MLKRIISVLIICTMLTTVSPAYAASSEEMDMAVQFAVGIGLLKGDENGYRLDDAVTRSEFVTLIMRMMGISSQNGQFSSAQSFQDVPSSYWAYADVEAAYQMGLVNGKGQNVFEPETNIILIEATKIIINAIGYSVPAQASGGYPTGYSQWAVKLGLYKGVSNAQYVSRRDVCHMIYNLLDEPVFDSVNNVIESNSSVLSSYLNLTMKKGTLLGTYNNYKDTLRENQVNISGKIYFIAESCKFDTESFIGKRVRCFIDKDETILCILPDVNNEDIVVNSDEIISTSTLTVFRYYNERNRAVEKRLNENITYIYNGRIINYDDLTDEFLKPSAGTVTLRDTNGDNVIDIILIDEYENYIVKYVSEQVIYDKYGKEPINLDSYNDAYTIYDCNGERIEWEDIPIGSVASVMKSIDNEFVAIYLTNDMIEGTVVSMSDNEEYEITTTEGQTVELKVAENYCEEIKTNSTQVVRLDLSKSVYKIYLDLSGRIADVEYSQRIEEKLYGYIYDYWSRSGSGRNGQIELLTSDGRFVVYDLNSNIKLGRSINSINYNISKVNAKDIEGVIAPNGEVKHQLLQYTLDNEGKISGIYMSGTKVTPDAELRKFTSQVDMTYRENCLNQQYYMDQNTKVFYAPVLGKYKKLLSAGRYTDYFKSGNTYTVDLYNLEDNIIDVVVINSRGVVAYESVDDGYETIIDYVNSPLLYVNEIRTTLGEDDEYYTEVSGYQAGEYVSMKLSQELAENSDSADLIKPGVVIQYETNAEIIKRAESRDIPLQIILFNKVFDFTQTQNDDNGILWEYTSVEDTNAEICVMWGTVTNSNVSMLAIEETGYICSVHGGTMVLSYNDADKFVLKTVNEIIDGRRVFVRQRYQNTREVVLY